MMRHDDFKILIQKSLDRETTPEEERVLKLHLTECTHCNILYNQLVQTEHALDGLIEFYPKQDFEMRVLKRLGFYRVRVWARAAVVVAGMWLASLLSLFFTPIGGRLFTRTLTSVPAVVRFFGNLQFILATISNVFAPLSRDPEIYILPIIGVMCVISFIFIFGKTIRKEVTCRAY